jgi:pimeloyl-ACP methyl ester carboxylesterase
MSSWPVTFEGYLLDTSLALIAGDAPVLLIHGTLDEKTPIRHSRELVTMNPSWTRLWEIPGARHTKCRSAQPEAYAKVVVDWLRSHP